MTDTEQYKIVCLQGAGFSSWDDPYTLDEIRVKFWEYAQDDGIFEDEEDHKYHIERDESGTRIMPEWFDIQFIKDIWEVEIVKFEEENV